ncbi:MAG: tetratricopeptide repeat protein [Caldilineaceae bacterium]
MLPERAWGAVLFADISGFTPLTNALVAEFGARRGADELTRQLNLVYNALITEVETFGGSVIGFSGDAITCWFGGEEGQGARSRGQGAGGKEQGAGGKEQGGDSGDEVSVGVKTATLRALASALAMQQAMARFAALEVDYGLNVNLAIKVAITAGPIRRLLVGDPAIQLIDVLAGSTMDRVAATEQMAQKGEVLLDAITLGQVAAAVTVQEWRTNASTGVRYAVVNAVHEVINPPASSANDLGLAEATAQPWVLPAIYARLLNEQGRFLAELRPATALFLRFEGIDYERDEQAGAKLAAYIHWVQNLVNRYEGSLIQLTTGDKGSYLYAAFGAPVAHDDDSLRAVAAARELRTPPSAFAFITAVQIGLSQGLMRVGAYGSDTRRTYGVLGEETNIAARLMAYASPGQVLLSAPLAEAVSDVYQLADLGLVKLKGKPEPQPVYAVVGARPNTDARLTRLYTTPLVGRDAELAKMVDALKLVQTGAGHILRVEGSAGIGKSHLTAHFIEQAKAQGLEVAVAACQSISQNIAYFAGRQIASALFSLTTLGITNEADAIERIKTAITLVNPNWLLRMPLLGDLLHLPIPDNPTTAAFDPRLRQEALISLAVEIAQTRAREQPLLLLFEDVHWIDEASQGLLLALARVIANAPILLVLVHRPPTRDNEPFLTELADLPHQTYLPLDELAPEGIAALVRNRLGGPVTPLALALIQAQAQGNPFFTEELLDALIDAMHLLPLNGKWALSQALVHTLRDSDCLKQVEHEWTLRADAPLAAVDLGVPTTIHGIVLARLDRLPEPAKLTLKVASVIGRIFPYELLVRAHPAQPDATILTQQLETLLRRDFARLETPEPRLSYIFKHNITQEVVYQTLLEDQLYELHLAVGNRLEELQPDKIEDLAFHFYNADLRRADVRGKTLYYLEAAGQRAQRDYANETALNYFNRALLLEQRWAWLKAKIEILHILGQREEEHRTLEQLALAPDVSEFEAALLWGEYHEAVSDYAKAQAVLQWALSLAQASDDLEGQARCFARLGMIAWRQGDYETAEKEYHQALIVINDEERFRDEEAEIRYGLGLVYRQQGKYDEAQVQFERDLALNRLLINRQNEARALNALGHVAQLRRNLSNALQYYRQALDIRKTIGDLAGVGASLLSLAQGLSNSGDYGQAEPILREALKIHQSVNNRWWEITAWNELGIVYLMVGEWEKAKTCLSSGLSLCHRIGAESNQAYILCNLGQVLREQGQFEEAENALVKGLLSVQAQGDVYAEATYYNDLAMVSLHTKRFEDSIQRSNISLEKFRLLNLLLSTTTNLAILASSYLALGNKPKALICSQEALKILDECSGQGLDYPHRDYWMCYQVLQAVGEMVLANHALTSAYHLLMQQAQRISELQMRQSYLENVPFNRSILRAATEAGLA